MSVFTIINSLRDEHIAKLAELEAAAQTEDEANRLTKEIEAERAEIARLTQEMWMI